MLTYSFSLQAFMSSLLPVCGWSLMYTQATCPISHVLCSREPTLYQRFAMVNIVLPLSRNRVLLAIRFMPTMDQTRPPLPTRLGFPVFPPCRPPASSILSTLTLPTNCPRCLTNLPTPSPPTSPTQSSCSTRKRPWPTSQGYWPK
jgi:hypothetical protein